MNKKHPYGVWIPIEEGTPRVRKGLVFDTSETVLIAGNDGCRWLAYWDGEVWHNANSSDIIWMNKEYVLAWFRIPRYTRKEENKYLRIAQSITQEYIENYGGDFSKIDELDNAIAEAIDKAIYSWFEELTQQ